MSEADKALLFFCALTAVTLLCIFISLLEVWPDTQCLIYGIDFNGRNEPFGLFCDW